MDAHNYIDGIRSLASIYSPSFFREIVDKNDLAKVYKKTKKYKRTVLGSDKSLRFKNFLSLLYDEMFKNYRNEYIFKNAIINKQLLGKYSINTTTLLNEFKISKAIGDIILVNGEVRLFEIKTDLDNLKRLDAQLNEYKKAVEKIFIVTDTSSIDEIYKRYSMEHYGIIEFTNSNTLRQHKDATEDFRFLNHQVIFKLLKKEEYLKIVKHYFQYLPEVPNTKIFKECLSLVEKISIKEFQRIAFREIKERTINQPELLIDPKVPYEIKLLCYILDFKPKEYSNLFNLLRQRI